MDRRNRKGTSVDPGWVAEQAPAVGSRVSIAFISATGSWWMERARTAQKGGVSAQEI
jgi:hypothetical protein